MLKKKRLFRRLRLKNKNYLKQRLEKKKMKRLK